MPAGQIAQLSNQLPLKEICLNVGCAGLEGHKSRQGRLNPCKIGQSSFQDLSCCGRWFPTLKRWAILECPSGTKAWTGFGGILENQILTRHWTRMSALRK